MTTSRTISQFCAFPENIEQTTIHRIPTLIINIGFPYLPDQ